MTTADLPSMSADEFDRWTLAYRWGYVAGIERGRQLADEEAATLHAEAVRVVRSLAGIEPRDEAADDAAHARREAWWSDRRDERRSA